MTTDDRLGRRSDKNVGSRVMKGAALMAVARVLVRGVSFLNLIVLARLLDPRDYGIAALAIATMTLLQNISDVRVNAAIINLKEITPTHLATGFTLTLARGLLLGLALLLGAEAFAAFSRSPDLVAPLRALAVVPVLDGLRNPAFILYQRQIDFSREFGRTLVSTVVGSVAVIAAALWLRSYWAIVVGTIAVRFMQSALTYWRVPARLGLSLSGWREFARFGGWLTLAGILEYVRSGFGPSFLFGRYLGSAALGVFSVALTLATILTRELAQPLQAAILPGLATLAHDPARLRAAFRDAQSFLFGLVYPIGVGLAVLAPELIALIAGPKWIGGAPLVRLLAPAFALSLMNAGAGALAQAKGRTRLVAERNLVITLVTVPPLWYAAAELGLFRATAILAMGVLFETLLTMRMAAHLVGSPTLETLTRNWRTLVAAAAMAAAVLATGGSDAHGTRALIAAVLPRAALGAAVHAATLFVLWRLAGRPTGFETKAMDMLIPRLPARVRPVARALRGR